MSDREQRTERDELAERIESLQRQIDALSGSDRPPEETHRIRANYERQLELARKELATLPDEPASETSPTTGRPQQRTPQEPLRDAPPHPIEANAGAFVRVSDLVGLQLGNDNAFSASTRAALTQACRVPVRLTDNGDPVIGPASFLRAELSISAASQSSPLPSTLGQALVEHLTEANADLRQRLAALTSGQSATGASPPPASAGASTVAPAAPQPDDDALLQRAIADPDLTRALADAARLVREFGSREIRIDVTHAIIAMLRSPSGQAVFRDLKLIVPTPELFFAGLSGAVLEFLSRPNSPFPNLDTATRSRIAQSVALVQLRMEPDAISLVRFVADAPERSLDADRLGMADDARALAEVICLREPGPPLAIGLFGDWGSGKSTFMNLIEAAIGELTTRTAKDTVAREAFVSKVVHIRFNAWHYNDSNLWASITSEFFSQLRSGGSGGSDRNTYEALVREVLARVESLDGDAAMAAVQAASARGEAADHQRSLEQLEERRKRVVGGALKDTAEKMVREIRPEALQRVEHALALLGQPVELAANKQDDPTAKRDALAMLAARELGNITESSSAVAAAATTIFKAAKAQVARWPRLALQVGVLLYVAVVVWAARADLGRWLSAIGVTAVPFGIVGWRAFQAVQPVALAVWRFVRRSHDESREIVRQERTTRDKLEEAQRRSQAADLTRARTEADAARFRAASPERVFDYYLNVSADTRQFEQQLGTVSQVRKVFEQLNAIYRERRNAIADGQPAATASGVTGFDIDRIVLYIDDLDRCKFGQVVKVLEAVHLLLAFPLFVVVVGVDARWLQQSLLTVYKNQLRDVTAGAAQQATVQDYLEKIFQIPIQLQQLSIRSNIELRPYLHAVAGPVEAPPPATQQRSQPGSTGAVRSTLEPIEVVLRPVEESARETALRVALRSEELTMIEALAPLLGKSPRTVKRFMNVYRLMRSRRRGTALEAFLSGADGTPAEFPACQFWLALDMGLTPEVASYYRAALTDTTVIDLPGALRNADVFASSPSITRLRRYLDEEVRRRHADALSAVLASYPGPRGRQTLLRMEVEVRRFSLPSRMPVATAAAPFRTGALRQSAGWSAMDGQRRSGNSNT